MKSRIKILVISMCAALCGLINIRAAVTTASIIAPSQDAFTSSDGVGQGSGLATGQVARINAGANRHYLVQFNTSPYNGQSLVKATLTLKLSSVATSSGTPVVPPKLKVFKMMQSWASGATWTSRGGALGSWGPYGPCGDADTYTPVALLTPEASPANGTTYTFDVTTALSNWMDGTDTNYGFLIEWENSWSGAGATDYDRQWVFNGAGAAAGSKPKLDLTFAAGPTVNVKTGYGAAGDGTTDDTAAFQAAAAYLQSQGGGTLYIPSGIYIVGNQTANTGTQVSPTLGTKPYWVEKSLIWLTGVNGLLIKSDPNGSTHLKWKAGMHFGSFDKTTGVAIYPTLPYYDGNSAATPGLMMWIINSQNIVVKNINLNGNSTNLVIGGKWSASGWQIPEYGFACYDSKDVTVMAVNASYHPLDGFIIKQHSLTESSPATPHTLHQCTAEYNGRNGFTWGGGIVLNVIRSNFNNTAKSNVVNNPGDGLDIEPDGAGGICRKGLFWGCFFVNNNALGIDSETIHGGNAEFDRCYVEGTTNYAIWPCSPYMRFVDCHIRGTVVTNYHAVSDPSAGNFYGRCTFDDNPALGSVGTIYSAGLVVYFGGWNTVLDTCTIDSYQGSAIYVAHDTVKNCTITHHKDKGYGASQSSLLNGSVISNTRFKESFPAGTTNPCVISAETNVVFGTGVFVDGPLCKLSINWAWPGIIGAIPPTP